MSDFEIIEGDCLDGLRELPDASVDAVVTDPPAGIGFMGKSWDSDKGGRDQWVAWLTGVMRECLRVLKPGGHALVWAIPRTSHWTATAIEDAGFEIRDRVSHLFGTGFPKSLDVSKAIDAAAGVEREVVGIRTDGGGGTPHNAVYDLGLAGKRVYEDKSKPATAAAAAWSGWGTALKPAVEDWWLARKPFDGTVAANVLEHGTGALNIDVSRVGDRWPANVALDEAAANDLGDPSRFFYVAKPSSAERDLGLDDLPVKSGGEATDREDGSDGLKSPRAGAGRTGGRRNTHPTVKAIALMRWLVRLITPPGGVVLDPFCGSGSTGCAAVIEGFDFLGIEREHEYVEIARRRILAAAGKKLAA